MVAFCYQLKAPVRYLLADQSSDQTLSVAMAALALKQSSNIQRHRLSTVSAVAA